MSKENGITLIALVVMIIVLLILAGISIVTFTGDSGILNQANNAKREKVISDLKENIGIKKMHEAQNSKTGVNSEEDVYDSIYNKISDDDSIVEVFGEEIKYNPEKFTAQEQRILRNEFDMGSTTDNIKPYGTIEKEIENGKVKLKIFTADDETDVKKIILPDNSEKVIEYDKENILYQFSENGEQTLVDGSKRAIKNLKGYFKNVVNDNNISKVSEIGDYNIVLNLNGAWSIKNFDFVNDCFKNGIGLITSGDDNNTNLEIIEDTTEKGMGYYGNRNKLVDNEVTKKLDFSKKDVSGRLVVHYKEMVNTWVTETIDGVTYDMIGMTKGEKGNYWLDYHNGMFYDSILLLRNSIYRVLGTRSAEYIVTSNGTYTFKIVDINGNVEEVSVEVTEL